MIKPTDPVMEDQDRDRDQYQHVVLFECADMSAELKKKIQSHFKVTRKSGGGECGEVRRVERDLYGIAFQEEEVKQRVLQKPKHTLDLPGGALVLTVRDGTFPAGASASDQPVKPAASPPQDEVPVSAVRPRVKDKANEHPDEKLTSVRVVGEAKLRLLWAELQVSLREMFPGVEVQQGDPGQLVLSGSAAEIHKAGNLIADRESSVLERTISNKSPYFLDFLRRVCGGPGERGGLFGVGDQVDIELGETELVLVSRSAEKLDAAERKMEETFVDLKMDVPQGSSAPRELLDELESKVAAMNRGGCRVQVSGGPGGTVWVQGHTKEVQELKEHAMALILDQVSVDGKVPLPFPELVPLLPHLLGLHSFDHSGVTLVPSDAPGGPVVELSGPSSRVTEVRSRLGPLLDSLTKDRVTVSLAGSLGYLESDAGQEAMQRLAESHRSLVSLERPRGRQTSAVAMYNLPVGLQVLVCQGDITEQHADVLVNAANEHLDHCGGVAAALSRAGGPRVQRESDELVRRQGRVPTGGAVMTTGGDLRCKKLVHVVGPVKGRDGNNDRMLVEKAAYAALDLADRNHFRSIAIPCISSGIFGVPLPVCASGIVSAVKTFSGQLGRQGLSTVTLIDTRAEAVRALKDACDRILQGTEPRAAKDLDLQSAAAAAQDGVGGASAGAPGGSVRVKVVCGTIQTQQVDVLVSPMVGLAPDSTRVGYELCAMAGPGFDRKFATLAAGKSQPGEIVVVENLPALKAKAVVFISLTPWNDGHGPIQALNDGVRQTLAFCEGRGFTSVAFPSLGVGAVLRFPHHVTFNVLQEEVAGFEKRRAGGAPLEVRVVVHPGTKESSQEFQTAVDTFCPGGLEEPERAPDFCVVSSTADAVTAMMGGLQLQVVRGDIVVAGTDVIVNSTGFSDHHTGVSEAILKAAGPAVREELRRAGAPTGLIYATGPGSLSCSVIVHASFKSDAQTIRSHCRQILERCEAQEHRSVAFPAVNTGQGGMSSARACRAMLDGMAAAAQHTTLRSLCLVRICILKEKVFQAFRTELENRTRSPLNLAEKTKQAFQDCTRRVSKTLSRSTGPEAPAPPAPQPAVVSVISCGRDVAEVVRRDLEELVREQQQLGRCGGGEGVAWVGLPGAGPEPRRTPSPGAGPRGGAGFEPGDEAAPTGPGDDRDKNEYVHMYPRF